MFAVIHLPDFSLQAVLRHEPESWSRPVALVDPTLHPPRICGCTESAAQAGVSPRQTPTQAQARCRDIVIRSRSVLQEESAREGLIQCAYGFSPHLEWTHPGILTLDLSGLAELKKATAEQLRAWGERANQALKQQQYHTRIGIGPTSTLAQHAAQWGPPIQVVEHPEDFVNRLPIAALRPSSDVATLLEKWGIRTVGELMALGQAEVTERLGLEAFSLFAAASPHQNRPLKLVGLPDRYEEQYDFDPPIETSEPLLFLLRRWVDQFSHRLDGVGLVAGALTLRWRLESGRTSERCLRLPHPTAQSTILFRLLQTFLETLQTDSPLVGVSLQLDPAQPVHHQFTLFEAALKDPHQLQETLGRLAALVGSDRVGTPVRRDNLRPDTFQLVPPDFEHAPTPSSAPVRNPFRAVPIRRLRPSAPAQVVTGKPVVPEIPPPPGAMASSAASGPIRFTLGPWRQSGQWWENGGWSQDEWDVETRTGMTCRLVHTADGWQVVGLLD